MNNRFILLLLIIIFVIINLISCTSADDFKPVEPESTIFDEGNQVTNLGLYTNAFQKHDGWVYYLDYAEGANLYRVRADGKDRMQIGDDTIYYFEVNGDRIYYISRSDYYLYSINIDGSAKESITPYSHDGIGVKKIEIVDEWIYAQLNTYIQLWKIKTDGSEFIELDDNIMDFCIDGDWIYYFSKVLTDEEWVSQLWRMRTDGTQKQQLMQEASPFIDYDDKWIYYVDHKDKSINKVGFDGEEKHKIVDCGDWAVLKVIDDWLYYFDGRDSPGMYKIKTDGSERTKITDNTYITFIDIWDNWLLCQSTENILFIRVSHSYDTDEIIKEIVSAWPTVKIYE